MLSSCDVHIRTSDSHSILDLEGNRINSAMDVTIGNDVWVCQRVTMLKGSEIPSNCVVAYGSIVTKRFSEKNCIFGGNPAKIIKNNISWKGGR